MEKKKPSRRSTKRDLKKKTVPPVGMIAVGVGVVLIGVAALFVLPKSESAQGAAPEEYSSIPMSVEYDAPELELTNLAGEKVSLSDYEGQKIILVNLWATWCPPCKEELPVLQQYYEDHADEGFVIVGIDYGEPAATVEAFLKTNKLTYPVWIDEDSESGLAFSSYSLPASFVIDRNGVVRLAWTGAISQAMLEKHVTPVIQGDG
ncbi:MAG: TlpA family protein disulfide reductase [Anaerolineae bacterium]|jgi:peroxiredoxin|nr:TlpA family protein disulfide reductase [Anaerolineae bacterium]MBT7070150.1 TlpA family protein disulfide reductase [Anaerolineae bacterium]MBT7326200.1 TlpA family protein disulfide reductase [Anaerolineae bacterium]